MGKMYCMKYHYRGYSCYRLSTILKVKLKSFHHFLWMALTTCLINFMRAGWGKYPNESEWKLGWVRITLQTPLLLVSLENTDNLYSRITKPATIKLIVIEKGTGLGCYETCRIDLKESSMLYITYIKTGLATQKYSCSGNYC